jgi:hypothetical protein
MGMGGPPRSLSGTTRSMEKRPPTVVHRATNADVVAAPPARRNPSVPSRARRPPGTACEGDGRCADVIGSGARMLSGPGPPPQLGRGPPGNRRRSRALDRKTLTTVKGRPAVSPGARQSGWAALSPSSARSPYARARDVASVLAVAGGLSPSPRCEARRPAREAGVRKLRVLDGDRRRVVAPERLVARPLQCRVCLRQRAHDRDAAASELLDCRRGPPVLALQLCPELVRVSVQLLHLRNVMRVSLPRASWPGQRRAPRHGTGAPPTRGSWRPRPHIGERGSHPVWVR